MNTHDRADRARGLLLGAALGDALGAPFEGRSHVPEDLLDELEEDTGQLPYTDDTVLTLVLAEHLLERGPDGDLDEDTLATGFARAWEAEPGRGWGGAVRDVFGEILAGGHWQRAAARLFGGAGSFGNGGAMRVAPVALVASDSGEAAELGRRSARITHAHPDGFHGAAVQACAAWLALSGFPDPSTERRRFLDVVAGGCGDQRWFSLLEQVDSATGAATPERAGELLGNDVSAVGSVPLALLAFLLHPDSPREAMRFAIRAGGDTDTVASMAGALAGARCGAAALPEGQLRRLEGCSRLYELGTALAQ
ncbi:ADP-ribosylglycohydrolase family protein [Actinopolyspora mortivallis]|uniref:ADP-ribosylglycohydrolase family protein n=1 Tax=Actinopolyspora mortivallis TaxID=33906 RepID=UPI00037C1F6D|nr:ADP-ribosylglycohydrolase family protein [Actinopolyspora mortivallis]